MTIESRASRLPWRPRPSGGMTAALLLFVLLGCTGIREDELACEDAVSHLQGCCSGFTGSNVDCTYEAGGCSGEGAVNPELDVTQSACIRGETCEQLRSTGVCARAAAIPGAGTWEAAERAAEEDPTSTPRDPQVCP